MRLTLRLRVAGGTAVPPVAGSASKHSPRAQGLRPGGYGLAHRIRQVNCLDHSQRIQRIKYMDV